MTTSVPDHRPKGNKAAALVEDVGPMLSLVKQISMNDGDDDPGKIGNVFLASTERDSGWIIDSGATHMTYYESLFHHITMPPKENVITANNEIAQVTGAGSIALPLYLCIILSLFFHYQIIYSLLDKLQNN